MSNTPDYIGPDFTHPGTALRVDVPALRVLIERR
jgi:hypothetical protein